ncbi:hypothetical protein A1Q1_03168 [Trichosporon asahii var. asahii CBS 2479]|uniref:Uncharacterized protein n=1 Tax=Trichosporon asahii var. asahii (strain ATCC 90039 / CBS 2479 / JCM 2466 / KCTC 7840 / NBRC 103889/ NCYC 2677 / UAMH 7654) TaxID=1186058 RepID=J5QL87_TRIAS|nr:hypothetical protein A1Q1_03168 [Trichosporon asahii var. asahii CBS 2479]EJT47933.1 hypothetical protein A1Q1_03168 [Trichosporon asahii var. asahii CBS 2479]
MGRRKNKGSSQNGALRAADGSSAASMPQPIVPSSTPKVRRSSRVNKNRALNSDAQAQQSGGTGKLGSPSGRKRLGTQADGVSAQATNLVSQQPQQAPKKRKRVASTSKGTSTSVPDVRRPPPPTSSTSNKGLSTGKDKAATLRLTGDPARMSDLDARIQAKINARAQVALSLAQIPPAPVTPKDTGLEAIIRAKIRARADSLGSSSVYSPAAPTATSPSVPSSHHRPLRLLGSPGSGGISGASPGNSDHPPAGTPRTSDQARSAKRSKRQQETQTTPRRTVYVEIPRRARISRVSTQPSARSPDKADVPLPQVPSSLPADTGGGSGSSPTDTLSSRIAAKIRDRAEKAEARRLSLGTGSQVTTPPAPAMDTLTAKIHAKIQARAKEQTERRMSQDFQTAQTLITESGSPVARLSESGTRSTHGASPASGPAHVGARRAKADNAKTSNPKKRKSQNANDINTQQGSAWAPPPGPLGSKGLAPGPRGSRDASLVSPHMASPVSPGSRSGPDAFRRSLPLSDSESSESSPFSPQPQRTQSSLSKQASRTSSASVSDILASSPGPFGGLSSPQSEMTFLIPSSPPSPPPIATASAAETSTSTAETAAAAATSAAHANVRSRWRHRSPERPGSAEHAAKDTGKGAVSTPQLVRAGPRWTVTTPRL